MVVQHNLTAMNSNRMLGLTTASQAKSTEKLSSGYKINRAADDAAGLSISEKMRKQIRGLTQASSNAQDGISAVQTAEGALTEVHDMLQRMNELAVKASNGTNSEDDREYIQNEIDQLTTEIDRVSTTTKFNETYLLQGDAEGVTAAEQTVEVAGVNATIAKGATVKAGTVELGKVGLKTEGDAKYSTDVDSLTGPVLTALNGNAQGTITLTATVTNGNVDKWTDGDGAEYTAAQLKESGITVNDGVTNGQTIVLTKKFEKNDKLGEKGVVYATEPTAAQLKDSALGSTLKTTIKNTNGTATMVAYDSTYVPDALKLDLHVGADSTSDNKIQLEIKSMSSSALGLLNSDGRLLVNGKDSTNADAAIDTIAAAIQKVSTQRSALGAVQNRLEHTINNLDNVVENTTSAESAIRDTDMATEMVKYSNNNILSQAGQAMLAQANQSNQGVLSLLQ